MKASVQGNQIPALFIVMAIVVNHAIFRLGAMPWAWIPLLIVVVGFVAITIPHLEIPGDARPRLLTTNIAIGVLIAAPAILSLVLGWNREFPFSGDQGFHVKQIYYMSYWWAQPIGTPGIGILGRTLGFDELQQLLLHPLRLLFSRAAILAAALVITAVLYRRLPILAVVFSTIAFIAWGASEHSIYLRYPGASYVFDQFFAVPAFLSGYVELAGRTPNVIAVIVWLFAFRPLMLKRWPDIAILPAAVFLLWQKDMLYFIDSTYLEPWAFICTFLAVELVIGRGRNGVPLACMAAGAAACFKEPFIIVLPLVWLAGIFPWQSLADAFRTSVFGFVGGFPFLFYYIARKSVLLQDIIIDRTYDFAVAPSAVGTYVSNFIERMAINFSGTSGIAALIAIASFVAMLFWLKDGRFRLLCMAAAAVEVAAFFTLDEVSQYWAGYFRFFIPGFAFMACGLVALGYALKPRHAMIFGILIVVLQMPGAYVAVARSAGPASDRSFVEHYDSALVFPIRDLLKQARAEGYLLKGAPVISNRPDDTVRTVPGIDVTFAPLGELQCACTSSQPNVMALFVRYTNLSKSFADRLPTDKEIGPYRERDELWKKNRTERPACLAKMRQTCKNVVEKIEGGEIVGALGTH